MSDYRYMSQLCHTVSIRVRVKGWALTYMGISWLTASLWILHVSDPVSAILCQFPNVTNVSCSLGCCHDECCSFWTESTIDLTVICSVFLLILLVNLTIRMYKSCNRQLMERKKNYLLFKSLLTREAIVSASASPQDSSDHDSRQHDRLPVANDLAVSLLSSSVSREQVPASEPTHTYPLPSGTGNSSGIYDITSRLKHSRFSKKEYFTALTRNGGVNHTRITQPSHHSEQTASEMNHTAVYNGEIEEYMPNDRTRLLPPETSLASRTNYCSITSQ